VTCTADLVIDVTGWWGRGEWVGGCTPDTVEIETVESKGSKGGDSVKATLKAVFEDGVFKPVERPGIPEGERVQITVETLMGPGTEDSLELAANVYRGLRPEEIDEIERIALDRSHFFTSPHS
jgi:predicted DNA-binding antitoxin AbrB/MazE fold protein